MQFELFLLPSALLSKFGDVVMTESITKKSNEIAFYESPEFTRHSLATITLGGSPGAGDSGAPNSESPFGERLTEEPPFEEGWEDGWSIK